MSLNKMLKKWLTPVIFIPCGLSGINCAYANYIEVQSFHVMHHGFSTLSIPNVVGGTTDWYDNDSIYTETIPGEGKNSYIDLSVNGQLLADNVTWATSNPGIGIQYQVHVSSVPGYSPQDNPTAPNYRINLPIVDSSARDGYYHVWYRLVRLSEKIPAGTIISVPDVTMNVHNPDGDGVALDSGLILSGVVSQPIVTACTINAPKEIKLSPLYGASLASGASNITDVPKVELKNCPGAINGITYNLFAVYGAHNANNGVLNTVTGDGYASNVYIQVQNADGSAHKINSEINLGLYDGSGDYTLPDFKVAYYIDDAATVTAGNVKSAIELKVTYN